MISASILIDLAINLGKSEIDLSSLALLAITHFTLFYLLFFRAVLVGSVSLVNEEYKEKYKNKNTRHY